MTLEHLNGLTDEEAVAAFSKCCGSAIWVEDMMEHMPFASTKEVFEKAEKTWFDVCKETDWLEAFTHHPKIGDLKSLEEKFASTKAWAGDEQSGVGKAAAATIVALANGNKDYEEKFGFIFIVCATGKSADEMLQLLNDRLPNQYDDEIRIAMKEQHKITTLRLKKMLS